MINTKALDYRTNKLYYTWIEDRVIACFYLYREINVCSFHTHEDGGKITWDWFHESGNEPWCWEWLHSPNSGYIWQCRLKNLLLPAKTLLPVVSAQRGFGLERTSCDIMKSHYGVEKKSGFVFIWNRIVCRKRRWNSLCNYFSWFLCRAMQNNCKMQV